MYLTCSVFSYNPEDMLWRHYISFAESFEDGNPNYRSFSERGYFHHNPRYLMWQSVAPARSIASSESSSRNGSRRYRNSRYDERARVYNRALYAGGYFGRQYSNTWWN